MFSHQAVSSLQDFENGRRMPVVSLYLDVDGSRFPARSLIEAELGAMLRNARKPGAIPMELDREQAASLDEDLEAISHFVSMDFQRGGARGLALFTCHAEGLWQTIPLGIPVENRVFIDRLPRIAPLAELLAGHGHICILVTSKETARIFRAFAGSISEYTEIFDEVPGRHDQGGWEQSKLQRWHDLEVREHLKRASDATLALFKKEGFQRLVVGIADELWPELERVLHPYLRERLSGRFSVDIGAGADEIMERAAAVEREQAHHREEEMLRSLGPEMAAGRRYVGGLDDTLAVLNQRRVETLIVESGFNRPGRRCPACDSLIFSEETCPSCSTSATPSPDIVDDAKEAAIRQGAALQMVEQGHPAMSQAGGIAARLRY
jgi:peptide chain release factor subunit 1